MNQLILGNKNYSSWSLRPWLALKKANIEFEETVVELYQGDYKRILKSLSPSGKVPVLITLNTTIWDSLAICEFAAELNPALWPSEQNSRAVARSISHEMHSGFPLIRHSMPMNCRAHDRKIKITDELYAEIQRIETIWTDCINNEQIDGSWLLGKFSIADAMYVPIVSRFYTYGISLNSECAQYIQTVLDDVYVKQWYSSAAKESSVIESSEIGNY